MIHWRPAGAAPAPPAGGGLVDVAVTRTLVLVLLAGELVEEADLAKHRADAAHLEHQPLDGFVTAGRVLGSNWPVFSARYSRIAPDSNSGSGLPSGPLGSMMAGILLFGFSDRNSGDSWSLLSKLTSAAHTRRPVSSSAMETFTPSASAADTAGGVPDAGPATWRR
jgi:hypothetical protein